jgi:hypothetical protein
MLTELKIRMGNKMPQSIDNQWRQCPYCHTKHDRFIDCPNPKCPSKDIIVAPPTKRPRNNIFDNVVWPK